MHSEYRIPLMDMVFTLSSVVDMINPQTAHHHEKVAYICARLARQAGVSRQDTEHLILAAGLHDIGSFSSQERSELLEFELEYPQRHAEIGYLFIRKFKPFDTAAGLIRFHHLPWDEGRRLHSEGLEVPPLCHLLHLADRIDVLINPSDFVLSQCPAILGRIKHHSGSLFNPEYVSAFEQLAQEEAFWLDICAPSIRAVLADSVHLGTMVAGLDDLASLARLLSHIIDFKSPFTSSHTAGVASTAMALAKKTGFTDIECRHMEIAALLHDLGKLAVPGEILQKPASLEEVEFDVIRSHTYYTRRILDAIPGFDTISDWASNHHERLDGRGYPFKERSLSLGARILAVADVFTALTEDRPYRAGMCRAEVAETMGKMVAESKLDQSIVKCLFENYPEIDMARSTSQQASLKAYDAVFA